MKNKLLIGGILGAVILVIVTVTDIANAENYEFCKDPICTINYLNGTSKELSCNADFSDFEDRGMKVSDECKIDYENLPSFDYAEFSKTTRFNRCTENSICFGTFSNGTQIKIQCESRVDHGCGPILVDSYNMIYKSPLKQIKNGVALIDVQCSEGKYAVYKYNRMRVACVSEETLNELWLRGWATMRLVMPGDNISHALCNNYEGKWHPKYFGCRDISDLQCSLMGGEFVDDLSICENGICPDKLYSLCITNQNLYMQYPNETEGDFHNRCGPSDTLRGPTPMPTECDSELIECTYVCGDTHGWLFFDEHGFEIDQSVAGMIVEQNEN